MTRAPGKTAQGLPSGTPWFTPPLWLCLPATSLLKVGIRTLRPVTPLVH